MFIKKNIYAKQHKKKNIYNSVPLKKQYKAISNIKILQLKNLAYFWRFNFIICSGRMNGMYRHVAQL